MNQSVFSERYIFRMSVSRPLHYGSPAYVISFWLSLHLLPVCEWQNKNNKKNNKKDTHFLRPFRRLAGHFRDSCLILKSEESTLFIHFLNDSIDHCKNFSFIPNRKRIKSTQQQLDR
ncbi:hypothetical protein J7439_25265, partial [Salinisphaera sp. G21_0]|nr:hypothetical protein [Salinisphaera sp. G21_0]